MGENGKKQPDELYRQRHSLAHILAYAVQDIYGDVKFGVGPVIENGFYYDFDLKKRISEDDLAKIEKRMREIIKKDYKFEREEVGLAEAKNKVKQLGQPYKEELVNDIITKGSTDIYAEEDGAGNKADKASFYTIGGFTDLCRGGHSTSTGKVGAFKLTKVSGAYWRGDEKNPQMQRVYGVAFKSKEELDKHLKMVEEAKKRDHRKLGQELDLFTFSDLVGTGLPLFTPRGTVIRSELAKFSEELQAEQGYMKVHIPHIAKVDLYKTSGHYDKFPEKLTVKSHESNTEFMMKPMNCPHHIQIFASSPRSYRDLPVRYMETTVIYRDEKAGELHGLSRVRAATQDDGHVFCRPQDIEVEFTAIMNMIKQMYSVFDMRFKARLSFRDDSDGYLGDPQLWKQAQTTLEKVAKVLDIEYYIEEGEAAFYGPKIDIMVTDALGREWQCATEQLDFVMPERFGLSYVDADGNEKRPVMIHKALLGSIERFMAVYIEHTAGRFPVWLAPEQVRIITVNQEKATIEFTQSILEKAKELKLRITADNSNESVGKKIRNSELSKVPYVIVVGEKEIDSGEVVPRVRDDMEVQKGHSPRKIEDFLKTVKNEAMSRVTKTSL